jgi:hypothetical protein
VPRLVLLALLFALPCAARAAILTGWSQYGAGGMVEARVVTDDPACPVLIADGMALPMAERSAPTAAFPDRVCVAALPTGAKSASAGGRSLPVPVEHPRHIVLLGDTGCRLKGDIVQSCNDTNSWPFRAVARHAAAEHPDLVIHVGDFLYRESPCKDADERCAGSPWGDNLPTWVADFLSPGNDLLGAAVWVVERGNHEDCKRAGTGWTTLLGRDPVTGTCNPRDKPLLIDLDGVTLAVLDENDADDSKSTPNEAVVKSIEADLSVIGAAKPDWLITHHPFRGVSKWADQDEGEKKIMGANATLLAALHGYDESTLTLMLSGHIHNFQIENYRPPLPPQLVVGEGGDKLDTKVPLKLTGLVTGGQTIVSGLSIPGFGYVVMDRIGGSKDWRIIVHAANGKVLRHCSLKSRTLACKGRATF